MLNMIGAYYGYVMSTLLVNMIPVQFISGRSEKHCQVTMAVHAGMQRQTVTA